MQTQIIVFGNEKGGAGKTTVAMHVTAALAYGQHDVAVIDLDLRQQSLGRFLANRRAWLAANGVSAPMPHEFRLAEDMQRLATTPEQAVDLFSRALAEARRQHRYVIIDTPGGDTLAAREAHACADLIVTPMNDSFVDFDLLGQVDPVSLDLVKPSLYAETVWEARKRHALRDRGGIDWVVLRNRLATAEARNRKRVDERLTTLGRRIGFRIASGLRDRVIYRELFPFGLTVADLSPSIRPVAVSLSQVVARQELRALMNVLNLDLRVEAPAA